MVHSTASRITKQWWGASHFRLGSRGQPRPNKGFKSSHFKSVGEAIECLRWWKRLRRGTLAYLLNCSNNTNVTLDKEDSNTNQQSIITSRYIEAVENGKTTLEESQLELLSQYLGANLVKEKKRKFKTI